MGASWRAGPQRPPAPGDEVHVWRAELSDSGWPGARQLPQAERERAERMLRAEAGQRWAASRWALRNVLGRYLGEQPAAIELALGEHGKPRLATDPERLAFNLSHSGNLALVAVSRGREVGIDVERIEAGRDFPALAKRTLGAEQAAAVGAAPEPDRAAVFYAAWVRHEALVKCHGGGVWNPAAGEAAIESLEVGGGYAAALAVTGARTPPWRQFAIAPA